MDKLIKEAKDVLRQLTALEELEQSNPDSLAGTAEERSKEKSHKLALLNSIVEDVDRVAQSEKQKRALRKDAIVAAVNDAFTVNDVGNNLLEGLVDTAFGRKMRLPYEGTFKPCHCCGSINHCKNHGCEIPQTM